MQKRVLKVVILLAMLATPLMAQSQIYAKLNTIYACMGIINPQLEFVVGPHSSIVIDPTYSPWSSIKGKHFNFGILQNEYRFYIKREILSRGDGDNPCARALDKHLVFGEVGCGDDNLVTRSCKGGKRSSNSRGGADRHID